MPSSQGSSPPILILSEEKFGRNWAYNPSIKSRALLSGYNVVGNFLTVPRGSIKGALLSAKWAYWGYLSQRSMCPRPFIFATSSIPAKSHSFWRRAYFDFVIGLASAQTISCPLKA